MKKILLMLLIGAVFILAGFGLFAHYRVRQAMALLYEVWAIADEMADEIADLTVVNVNLTIATAALESEKAALQSQLQEQSTLANPWLRHQGLYADDVREAFLANEDLHAKIAEIAGLWPPLALTSLTVTDNYVLFPQGLVSFSHDQTTVR